MENKGLLGWMGDHPYLTFFLVVAVFEGAAKVVAAAKGNSDINKKGDEIKWNMNIHMMQRGIL